MAVERKRDDYSFNFDNSYFEDGKSVDLEPNDVRAWLEAVPKLKHAIDLHLGRGPRDEREFQQILVRENNFPRLASPSDREQTSAGPARSTDYYICDIEYASAYGRFDLIAVHWPSNPTTRKRAEDRRLVFVEMKYGDGDSQLDGTSGIRSHVKDVNCFLSQADIGSFKKDMMEVFNQKRRLGLVDCGKDLCSFSDEAPMLLLVLAHHDPDHAKLAEVLDRLPDSRHADVAIATASFMGYGLYDQAIHTLEEAQARFGDYIHTPR